MLTDPALSVRPSVRTSVNSKATLAANNLVAPNSPHSSAADSSFFVGPPRTPLTNRHLHSSSALLYGSRLQRQATNLHPSVGSFPSLVPLSVSVSVCHCLFVFVFVCLVSVCMSLYVFACLFLYVPVCLCLSVFVCASMSVSLGLSVCFSPSISVSRPCMSRLSLSCISLSGSALCVSVCLSLSISLYL